MPDAAGGLPLRRLVSGRAAPATGRRVPDRREHLRPVLDRVILDGQEFLCRLQADFAGDERILGRDVLNRVVVLFRGPGGEVVINP